jgi:uncharacterized phiE125 gp8 family phage protein
MGLKLTTPPASEPVTLQEIKDHLRILGTDEDALITVMIEPARDYCEKYQNRAYITQTWELALDQFPSEDRIRIPLPPLQSVSSVKYYGTDDTEYTLPAADYQVDIYSQPGRVVLKYGKSWPSVTLRPANGVIITFIAGYGTTADEVPERMKQAIKVLMGHLYENREATDLKELKEVPFAVHALLGLDRIWPV